MMDAAHKDASFLLKKTHKRGNVLGNMGILIPDAKKTNAI